MRRLTSFAAVLICALSAAGCSTDEDPHPTPTITTTVTTDPHPWLGQWTGLWHSGESTGQAVLDITDHEPLTGRIEIVDVCSADWREVSRNDGAVRVAATVTSGDCVDNQWDVTIDDGRLTTTDPNDKTNSLKLQRRN